MSELVEFLKARLNDEEAYADSSTCGCRAHVGLRDHVELKRWLVTEAASEVNGMDEQIYAEWGVGKRAASDPPYGDVLLRHIAQLYADHEDYRDEWTP